MHPDPSQPLPFAPFEHNFSQFLTKLENPISPFSGHNSLALQKHDYLLRNNYGTNKYLLAPGVWRLKVRE